MAKANTRQFDNVIATASRKLEAVRARQTWALTPGEQARLAGAGALVVAKATRLKSSPRAERAVRQIWENAEARYAAEVRAAEAAKQKAIDEAAAAKVAKKSSGWW
ncbi:hypothetical protein ACIOWI_34445 [Streptomyces sp. NPDC087659]|uniref:hypothetical protein n=1 Tax=Streptomyces sp. NPDC087659 TaxID=3365801 RepID=UPI0037FA508B